MADLLIMLQSLAPLRNRNFRLLWLAYLVSTMGDVFLEIGIMVTVYERTGSALKTGRRRQLSCSITSEEDERRAYRRRCSSTLSPHGRN
jgi:hypothetical protein|tara:strand:+ start:2598 stop:2864 length:267 start_codon:yes stop_codon:yes gene_type:complete